MLLQCENCGAELAHLTEEIKRQQQAFKAQLTQLRLGNENQAQVIAALVMQLGGEVEIPGFALLESFELAVLETPLTLGWRLQVKRK